MAAFPRAMRQDHRSSGPLDNQDILFPRSMMATISDSLVEEGSLTRAWSIAAMALLMKEVNKLVSTWMSAGPYVAGSPR